MLNDYDKTYDDTLSKKFSGEYSDYNSKRFAECGDALEGLPRCEVKSKLAKKGKYQKFREACFEIVNTSYSSPGEGCAVEWTTGGVSGGNCWNDNKTEGYTSDEPPLDLIKLDEILEKLVPDLSYLQFRKISREILHTGSYTSYEYYGNCTNYSVKYVLFSELYQALVKHKLLGND